MHLFRLNDSRLHGCALNETQLADDFRLFIVGFVGSAVASLSVLENALIIYIFSTSRKLQRQNYANPIVLALFDSIVSICYVLSAPVQVIAYRYRLETVVNVWAQYMRYAYCLHHVALTVSNFVLVVASIERLLVNNTAKTVDVFRADKSHPVLFCVARHKPLIFAVIIFLSIVFKGSLFFETSLAWVAQCPSIESLIPIWIDSRSPWQSARFWIRKLFTIILPFFILAFSNLYIVLHLKKRKRKFDQIVTQSQRIATATTTPVPFPRKPFKPTVSNNSIRKPYNEKRGVRVATRTLALVVGCYLISNTVTTIINIWEYFDPHYLRYDHYYKYLVASDLAVLLTISGCALRLPIYIFNDSRIRNAMFRALFRLRYRDGHKFRDMKGDNLEKYSIVIVSNSIRSNLTGMLSQDWGAMRSRKSFDQLGILVQNRRRFLVQMTISLGKMKELPERQHEESMTGDVTFLTDIQEEEHMELLNEDNNHSDYDSLDQTSRASSSKWHTWRRDL